MAPAATGGQHKYQPHFLSGNTVTVRIVLTRRLVSETRLGLLTPGGGNGGSDWLAGRQTAADTIHLINPSIIQPVEPRPSLSTRHRPLYVITHSPTPSNLLAPGASVRLAPRTHLCWPSCSATTTVAHGKRLIWAWRHACLIEKGFVVCVEVDLLQQWG